jgi:hypothetical protein
MKKLTSILVVTLFLVAAVPSFAGNGTSSRGRIGGTNPPIAKQLPPTSTRPGTGSGKACLARVCLTMPPGFFGGK